MNDSIWIFVIQHFGASIHLQSRRSARLFWFAVRRTDEASRQTDVFNFHLSRQWTEAGPSVHSSEVWPIFNSLNTLNQVGIYLRGTCSFIQWDCNQIKIWIKHPARLDHQRQTGAREEILQVEACLRNEGASHVTQFPLCNLKGLPTSRHCVQARREQQYHMLLSLRPIFTLLHVLMWS